MTQDISTRNNQSEILGTFHAPAHGGMYDRSAQTFNTTSIQNQNLYQNHGKPLSNNYERIITSARSDSNSLSPRRPDSARRGIGTATRRGTFGRSKIFELSTSPAKKLRPQAEEKVSKSPFQVGLNYCHSSMHPSSFTNDESFLSSLEQDGANILQLNLSHLNWLSNYACSFIGTRCLNLTHLNIKNVLQFDDVSLASIIQHGSLQQVAINDQTNVQQMSSIIQLLNTCSKTLIHLELNSMNRLLKGKGTNQIERPEENNTWWLNCTDINLEHHDVYGSSFFMWILYSIVQQEFQSKNTEEESKEEEDLQKLIENLFIIHDHDDNNDDNIEIETLECLYGWYMKTLRPTSRINESQVKYLYNTFVKGDTNNHLTIDMPSSEQEAFTSKYRKKKRKSKKKGASNATNGTLNPSILPTGGAIRPLKICIINTLTSKINQHQQQQQSKKKKNENKCTYIQFVRAFQNALTSTTSSTTTTTAIDSETASLPSSSSWSKKERFLSNVSSVTMTSLHVTNMNAFNNTHLSHLGNLHQNYTTQDNTKNNNNATAVAVAAATTTTTNNVHEVIECITEPVTTKTKDKNSTTAPALASTTEWNAYNDWIMDTSTWMATLKKTMKGNESTSTTTTNTTSSSNTNRVYFGTRDSLYDNINGTPSPPFANINSVMALSGTMAMLGNLLHAKLIDDGRCDRLRIERSTLLEFVHHYLTNDVEKQKFYNSITKFKENDARCSLFGTMVGWIINENEKQSNATMLLETSFSDIVLDIISRCCNTTDSRTSTLNQLIDSSTPVLVPFTLLKAALNFVLNGGLKHPSDVVERLFSKKMIALAKKLASSVTIGGQLMIPLFVFLEKFREEWIKKKIFPRLTARPGYLKKMPYISELDLSKKLKEKSKKTGEDEEGDLIAMNIWLSKTKNNCNQIQLWADSERKHEWNKQWQGE